MKKLSKHFTRKELVCSCGCNEARVKNDLLYMLEAMRTFFDKPIIIHSGFRCQKKQESLIAQGLTKSKSSQHTAGLAADLHVANFKLYDLHESCKVLQDAGIIDGLGLYNWGVHVDKRGSKAFWDNRK